MDDSNIIINNILCFVHSSKDDYTKETVKDVVCAFYSHEEIKIAKTLLCNILKKDLTWRRDPDKKRKDFNDILDSYGEHTLASHWLTYLSKSARSYFFPREINLF